MGEGVGLYRNGLRCTSELAREDEGEPVALLLREWWYIPSADVSDPDTGGERGSYKCPGEGGGGDPDRGIAP